MEPTAGASVCADYEETFLTHSEICPVHTCLYCSFRGSNGEHSNTTPVWQEWERLYELCERASALANVDLVRLNGQCSIKVQLFCDTATFTMGTLRHLESSMTGSAASLISCHPFALASAQLILEARPGRTRGSPSSKKKREQGPDMSLGAGEQVLTAAHAGNAGPF